MAVDGKETSPLLGGSDASNNTITNAAATSATYSNTTANAAKSEQKQQRPGRNVSLNATSKKDSWPRKKLRERPRANRYSHSGYYYYWRVHLEDIIHRMTTFELAAHRRVTPATTTTATAAEHTSSRLEAACLDDSMTASSDEGDRMYSGSSLRSSPSSPQSSSPEKLGVLSMAVLIFYSVSGGPFGIETTVRAGGNFYALLGFLVMPLVWSLQEALMTAELGTAFPEASGGVAWVEEAFGHGAGWMSGYLNWVAGATGE
mmetsp:Transcript_25676/g.56490  ORF Transcript_25676/g.56490 Transcript_25676/m.56490 type:complete len:260 (-) Transcript_25676:3602-4381(-)